MPRLLPQDLGPGGDAESRHHRVGIAAVLSEVVHVAQAHQLEVVIVAERAPVEAFVVEGEGGEEGETGLGLDVGELAAVRGPDAVDGAAARLTGLAAEPEDRGDEDGHQVVVAADERHRAIDDRRRIGLGTAEVLDHQRPVVVEDHDVADHPVVRRAPRPGSAVGECRPDRAIPLVLRRDA